MDIANLLDQLTDRARADANLVQSGARAAELKIHPALRNVEAAYRRALKDERAKIPTYLHAAIESVVRLLPAEPPKAAWERDQQGTYDMGPSGARLRPGS